MARAYFNETQRFRQWWIYAVIALVLASWVFSLITIYPETQKEGDNSATIMLIINSIFIPVIIYVLVGVIKLKTRIRKEGIYYRFVPLHFKEKFISPDEIEKFEVRKYKPIPEYGGWGVKSRGKKHGKAVNISGNMGLQLYLKNGKKLLIGTQKPRKIEKAVEDMMRKEF
jgi:hypothetical protein